MTCSVRVLVVLSLLAGHASPAAALDPATPVDQYARASWTDKDGLPPALISWITQDREGYLWLGTDAGLIRFDGVRFMSWEALGGAPLPGTTIRALIASRSGDLWIGFGDTGGISRVEQGRLITYADDPGLRNLASVGAILEDHRGAIWAGGGGGLSRFQDGRWEQMQGRNGLPDGSVSELYEDSHGGLWVITVAGLFYRAGGDSVFRLSPTTGRVFALAEDGAGTLWFADEERGFHRLASSDVPRPPAPYDALIGPRLLRDRHGNLWAATLGQGLWRISTARGSEPRVEHAAGSPKLTSNIVRALFEDREGNLWVGTVNGLNRISDASLITALVDDDIGYNVATSVVADVDGSVWVGTYNGLYRFAGLTRTRYDRKDGLSSGVVQALRVDPGGELSIATRSGDLMRFVNGKFVPVRQGARVAATLLGASTGSDDGLWFTDRSQGFLRRKGTVTPFEEVPQLRDKVANVALADRQRRVWAGFADGSLVVYEDSNLRSYTSADGVACGAVWAIYEDRTGAIWVGGRNGLGRFADGRFTWATTANGLPSNIRAIVEDGHGVLWFGGDAGIVRLNPGEIDRVARDSSHRIVYQLYGTSDGLRGPPAMPNRGYPVATRAGDGSLWFVTSSGGVAVVHPDRVQKTPSPPPVRVERVQARDRLLDPVAGLQLPPKTPSLEIQYTALSLSTPEKIQFRYILEGFDREWIDAGMRRQAFYTNLPPGDYRFRVVANNDGVWNEAGAEWAFSIEPAFYQTTWFYGLALTALSLTVFGVWRVRVRQLHHQMRLVLAERARVAREIHDTLLQSVAGVALQFHDLAREIETSPQTATTHVVRLRRYLETYAREARYAIQDLRSPALETRDLAGALRELGHSVTEGTSVQFELTARGAVRRAPRRVEEALLRIGQEALFNAVRHAAATRVTAEVVYDPESITLSVADNGRGFASGQAEQGEPDHWGLAIMRERANQIGGRLRVASTPGEGTQIEVTVMLSRGGR